MIYLQSGCDSAMLNGFMLDGLHKKSAQLAKLADKYHDQAAVRKTKFKEGQPLDPTTDLFRKATVHWKQNFELYDKPHLEKEFIEAAQKYEAVKKAHEAGKEFEPPKGTRIWSDVRLKCPEKMELAKLPEQQIVARKPKPQLPKGPPKAFSKRRQKGGGDPLSKAASSVANTENPKMENRKKENPKVAESKVGEPKMGNLKKEEQKKGEPKKEEVKQGDEQVKYVEPEAIVKRELKKDQPKKVFVMPRESIQLEKCHPLCLTSRVPSIYDTFKSKSTVLRDTFSVFSLVMEELDNYYEFHARALALINLNANHVEIKMVETARYGAQYDKVNSTWPAFPLNKQPKNRWAVNGRPHYQIPREF
ncbi:unnamed protein product [Caenorhabditis auriculariae]|uniref:Uncharacterized protein n=1 Tax=Caenorhabditis auriculariae TaxID=2777116 RepID=A0A8S1HKQ9_9PELO|nr:unnamed protein product [Caenorhabditis auriculariae]